MPIYYLSLEERATCPETCHQFNDCYGNNMHYAHRVDHRDPDLLMNVLDQEICQLHDKHVDGFVVRLHNLGDFFSETYAKFWYGAMHLYTRMRVFGYTAHDYHSSIGQMIELIGKQHPDRWKVRYSVPSPDGTFAITATVPHEKIIQCPAQTGQTQCCATCALCWEADNVAILFKQH